MINDITRNLVFYCGIDKGELVPIGEGFSKLKFTLVNINRKLEKYLMYVLSSVQKNIEILFKITPSIALDSTDLIPAKKINDTIINNGNYYISEKDIDRKVVIVYAEHDYLFCMYKFDKEIVYSRDIFSSIIPIPFHRIDYLEII